MSAGLDLLLLSARFATLVLGLALFGTACFASYAPPELHKPSVAGRLVAPALATVAAVTWLVLLARSIAATPGLPDAGLVLRVVVGTGFGRALAAAALLGIGLLIVGAAAPQLRRPPLVLSGAMLCAIALVGHAASGVGGGSPILREGLMAAHLLAAGAWLGGLLPLALAARKPDPQVPALLEQFGRMAFVAVMVVLGSGLVSLLEVLLASGGGVGRGYLRVLVIKLLLVGALLGVAAVNRLWLTPLAHRKLSSAIGPIRISLAVEQLVALGLVAAAAVLGQVDPTM